MLFNEFTYFIDYIQEGEYIKIPFEVPEDINKIVVEYDYMRFKEHNNEGFHSKEEINIVDFGIYSNDAFIGASGSNRQRIEISSHSDPGFSNVAIESGTWYIMAGAYKVEQSGVSIRYRVSFYTKELKAYIGDTHTHTVSSDGSYSYEELIQKAEKEGLDFLVLSDHNNYTQNHCISGREKITVIPGTEWTHYKGHANFLGIKKAISDPFIVKDGEEMTQLFNEARENGAIISVNHPFCKFCGWSWDLNYTKYDLVEIWNGGIHPDSNKDALKWWDAQLQSGQKISATAGSDFHEVQGQRQLGQPILGIWAHSDMKEVLLTSMKKGQSYLSYAMEGPSILLKAEEGIQGDTVYSKTVSFTFERLRNRDTIHFITNTHEEALVIDKDLDIHTIIKEFENDLYCRVEIYREPLSGHIKMPVSLSNPIYFAHVKEESA